MVAPTAATASNRAESGVGSPTLEVPATETDAPDADVALRTALDGAGKERLHGYRQVTDSHLAALSAARGGQLATFDGRLERSLAGTGLANAVALVQ